MLTHLKFIDHTNNLSVGFVVNEDSVTIDDIITKVKQHYKLHPETSIQIYCTGKDGKKINFESSLDAKQLIKNSKEVRYLEVYWKNTEHGKQSLDMGDSSLGKTLVGYKRFVSAEVAAGDIMVGDPNGVNVFIPAGAMKSGAQVSVKTVAVDESFFTELNKRGFKNVTAHVQNDPGKVNRKMNE
tara:strand:+ start:272 stop:823 length:552 start_codon:yes stop_codon:yes gene_type:complete